MTKGGGRVGKERRSFEVLRDYVRLSAGKGGEGDVVGDGAASCFRYS